MKEKGYETVTTFDEVGSRSGKPGKAIYKAPWVQVSLLLLILVYTSAALGFAVFVLWKCPSEGKLYRVLPTGSLKVDQFYSGLALSILFTPAALLIRRLAYDVALMHPFAVASRGPVEISDLDILMDPGIVAMSRLFRYSIPRASAQALIMAVGAFLVPVGTLLVFPGMHATPLQSKASVGMPVMYQSMMIMNIVMGNSLDDSNFFLSTATNVYIGNTISQMGILHQLPEQLGPSATSNLTYYEGVTYRGIVTYKWKSGCQYTDDIQFTERTEPYLWNFNVTMPDGTVCNDLDAWDTALCISNSTSSGGDTNTVYYAIMGAQEETANFANASQGPNPAITVTDGAWISRVACTPSLDWEVSSCTWRNGSMTDCIRAPDQNTTQLDNEGLDDLSRYMSDVPLYLYELDSYTFGFRTILVSLLFDPHSPSDHVFRAPTLQDYDDMYGLIAQSIVTMITAGYYGVAEVPTSGSTPKPVYLVRLHILAIIVVVLVLCPLAPSIIFLRTLYVHRAPLRPTTFLTIANAVRGSWWDAKLWGTCIMTPSETRDALRGLKVMFGVTIDDERTLQPSTHVGFAERVAHISEKETYFGVEDRPSSI